MYGRRRYWHRRSNTPMYYSRNPTKKLTPYLNNDPYRIESRDLPKAAKFLSQNGYLIYSPGDYPVTTINGFSFSTESSIPPPSDIKWQQGPSSNIDIPPSTILITFIANDQEGTFAFFVNRSSSSFSHYVSNIAIYTLYTPPTYGNLFINMYYNSSLVFRTYENLNVTTGVLTQLSSIVFSLNYFSFVLDK